MFIYFAELGLSCGHSGSLIFIVTFGIFSFFSCGMWDQFPDQGSNLGPSIGSSEC